VRRVHGRGFAAVLAFAVGCASRGAAPPATQLQLRQIQTRDYESADVKTVLKAVINALQDEGFIITQANAELGVVTGSRHREKHEPFLEKLAAWLIEEGVGSRPVTILDVTANVSEYGSGARLRLGVEMRALDRQGSPTKARALEEPTFYQDFFAKIDKSLFLIRQKM
jgi:hypothetical protein